MYTYVHVATGSEEVGFLKEKLDSLYQDLQDKEAAVSIESVRERVKECLDQAQSALDRLRLERQRYLDGIDQQTQEFELQGIIIQCNLDYPDPFVHQPIAAIPDK